MKTIDGKKIAEERLASLRIRVALLQRAPSLAVIVVGDDPASHLYVSLKEKAAKKVGIDFHVYKLSQHESEQEIITTVQFLREDVDIDGLIIQLPLPEGINTDKIIDAMGAIKDADGFHQENMARFIEGDDVVLPVFPTALMTLAEASGESLDGKNAVIIGKSDIFTQAMVAACTRRNMRVSRVSCEKLACMQAAVLAADVIFSACGSAKMLTNAYCKKGAIIIDGGITVDHGRVCGDVDQESFEKKEAYISPVPGGVGPVTIAYLLENVTLLAEKRM